MLISYAEYQPERNIVFGTYTCACALKGVKCKRASFYNDETKFLNLYFHCSKYESLNANGKKYINCGMSNKTKTTNKIL